VSQSSKFCRHNLCVASQRVFIAVVVVVDFVIDSVRKLLDTTSYMTAVVEKVETEQKTLKICVDEGGKHSELRMMLQ